MASAEKFEALDGVLGVHCGGRDLLLRPGQSAEVPLHTLHRFYNPSETGATDGQSRPNGAPKNFWYMALLIEMGESYFPVLPLRLQQGLFRLLLGLASLLGKHKGVEKYYRRKR
jgi:hypothetical protein